MRTLLEDLLIAARTILGEARGETYRGKKAVAHVLINRTNERIGDRDHSLAATCLRWKQFSAWLESDPNRKILEEASLDDRDMRVCLRAILEALDEEDFTNGANHYHTRSIEPYWAEDVLPCFEEGHHLFYKL